MGDVELPGRHAFLCYARVDRLAVDRLQAALEAAGLSVWRDTERLWPGEDWREKIRRAITSDAMAFVACFSRNSLARDKSVQYEELAWAVDELRQRRPDVPWLIPIRLDECEIPDWPIASGRTLRSLQRADIFGKHREQQTARLVTAITRILGPPPAVMPLEAVAEETSELGEVTIRDQRRPEAVRRRVAARTEDTRPAKFSTPLVDDTPRRYWDMRSRGVEDAHRPGWFFTGRVEVLRELVTWLGDSEGGTKLAAVTGDPGAGKSAVLARLVTFADSQFLTVVPQWVADSAEAGTLPRPGSIDAALYAAGLTVNEVASRLASLLGLAASDPESLLEALATATASRVILIDGLDEALDPGDLARLLIFPATRNATYGTRILLSSRRETLDRLRIHSRLDLNAAPYFQARDIERYVRALLRFANSTDGSLLSPHNPVLADNLVRFVARQAGSNFLVAQVAALELASTSEPPDASRLRARYDVSDRIAQAMDGFLHRVSVNMVRSDDRPTGLSSVAGCERWLRELLGPLAFAQGPGLVEDEVWARVASRMGSQRYRGNDVRRLRDSPASALLSRSDAADGETSWRLFHDALAQTLRGNWHERQVHTAFAEALSDRVPVTAGIREWGRADEYILKYLVIHAAHAGRLDELITDYRFLISASPDHLVRSLSAAEGPRARLVANLYLHHFAELREASSNERLSILQRAARLAGCDWLASAIEADGRRLIWPVTSARWSSSPETLRLTGHRRPITAIACAILDTEPVAVTGSDDGYLRVWDMRTGVERFTLEIENANTVRSPGAPFRIASTTAADAPIVAAILTGSSSGTNVWVWDLGTREVISRFPQWTFSMVRHPKGDNVICLSPVDQDAVEASLRASYKIGNPVTSYKIWNPVSGQDLAILGRSCTTPWHVAASQIDGRPVVVTGHDDGQIMIWDLASGEHLASAPGFDSQPSSIACASLAGDLVVISSSVTDSRTRVWRMRDDRIIADVPRGAYGITCISLEDSHIAVLTFAVRENLLGGNWVRREDDFGIVDLETGADSVHHVGSGQANRAVDSMVVDGRPSLITASEEIARVFDVRAIAAQDERRTAGVTAMTVSESGSPILTAHADGTVRVTDLTDEKVLKLPLEPKPFVTSLARAKPHGSVDEFTVAGTAAGAIFAWQGSDLSHPARVLTGDQSYFIVMDQDRAVNSVCVFSVNGRPIVAAAVGAPYLRMLNLVGEVEDSRFGFGHWSDYVASAEHDGMPVVVQDYYDGDETDLRMLNAVTGEVISAKYLRTIGWLNCLVCVEHDGKALALAGLTDGQLCIWNLSEPRTCQQILAHPNGVAAVTTCWVGGRLVVVTGGADRKLRVWRLPDMRCIFQFEVDGVPGGLAAAGGRLVVSGECGYAVLSIPADEHREAEN